MKAWGAKATSLALGAAFAAVCGEAAAAPGFAKCSWPISGGQQATGLFTFDVGEWRSWDGAPGATAMHAYRGGGAWSENKCPGAAKCEVSPVVATLVVRDAGLSFGYVIDRTSGTLTFSFENDLDPSRSYTTVGQCEATPNPEAVPPPAPKF